MHDLGTLGGRSSAANDINSAGEVAGYSLLADGRKSAFVYRNGTMLDLNTLIGGGWWLEEAAAINDAGQIAGTGIYEGERRAFRLDPVRFDEGDVDVVPAPEPSTWAMLLLGLGLTAVGLLKRWKRDQRPGDTATRKGSERAHQTSD
jgi:probable HAF family extracellular repeat protein